MLSRFRSDRRSERLRAIGWLVLVLGLVAAAATFGVATYNTDRAIDEAKAPGYARSMRHGMGEMMGTFGLMLTDWYDAWSSPPGQAITVAVCAALLAGYFFRVAWVLDDNDRNP